MQLQGHTTYHPTDEATVTFATFEFLMRAFYQEQGLPPATNEQMKEAWIEYLVEKKRKQSYQQAANNVSSRN